VAASEDRDGAAPFAGFGSELFALDSGDFDVLGRSFARPPVVAELPGKPDTTSTGLFSDARLRK
jgi:hypothetical protein